MKYIYNQSTHKEQIASSHNTLLGIFREYIIFCSILLFIIISFFIFGNINDIWNKSLGFWAVVYYVKTFIEIIASGFAFFYLLVALYYRKPSNFLKDDIHNRNYPNVVVAYLCCNDLDSIALENIINSIKGYGVKIWIHDDSTTEKNRSEVTKITNQLKIKYFENIQVIRRKNRYGGKPGAVNNIVHLLPKDSDYLVLCDSDSFLPNNKFLTQALSYFDDPQVALVQFRNIGHVLYSDTFGYKILSDSINFYDTFVSFMDKFGWSPFLGHNAIIRISVIKEVGGFTPGQLADDIDFSVKLRLHRYRIKYAREIVSGERHPLTYEALRLRTKKWAYGCTQILLRWGWKIIFSKKLNVLEKTTFFLTVGYYHFQILLLFYLCIFYILLPFKDSEMGGTLNLMISAGLILLFTFLPSITYFNREKNFSEWPIAGIYWGFTYGSQDFIMLKAVILCLFNKKLEWIPTNMKIEGLKVIRFLPELIFGTLIVVIALLQHKSLLILPTTILFVGKFLITPVLNKIVFFKGKNNEHYIDNN